MTDISKAFKVKNGLEATTATITKIVFSGDNSELSSASGAVGYTGSAGSTGYTGSAGTNGTNGDTGFTGSAGSTGYTGSAGSAGSFSGYASLKSGSVGAISPPSGGSTFDTPTVTYSEDVDSGGFAGTATDGFTLDAGTYDLMIVIRGCNIRDTTGANPGRLGFRLRNTTDSTNVDICDVASEWDGIYSGSARRISADSIVLRNIITIAATKTFQFQVRDETTSNGIYFSSVNGPALRVVAIKLA